MKLTLTRHLTQHGSTLGVLEAPGVRCLTLEDGPQEVKVAGRTRIPAGEYRVLLREVGGFHQRYGERFGEMHRGMLWLLDVPGFSWVLIHCGNTVEHTAGCLLVGEAARVSIGRPSEIQGSEISYRRIYPVIAEALEKGEEVRIEIEDRG